MPSWPVSWLSTFFLRTRSFSSSLLARMTSYTRFGRSNPRTIGLVCGMPICVTRSSRTAGVAVAVNAGTVGWPGAAMTLGLGGVAPSAVCTQIKDPGRNGGKDLVALRAHLDNPLVTWGWNPGFGRAPVSVPRETFLAAWETWAAAGTPCP